MSSKKPAAKPAAKAGAKPAAKPAAKKPAGKAAAPAKAAAAPAAPPKLVILPEVEIGLKELMVPVGDSQGQCKEAGRWPLIIDENERVIVFLRHRDCNNLDAREPIEFQPGKIRQALLGAIKYGKPITINLGDSGSVDIVKERFDEIMPDLYNLVMTKKILEDDKYMELVRDEDGDEYRQIFGAQEAFNVVFLSSNPTPTDETKGKVLVYKIV